MLKNISRFIKNFCDVRISSISTSPSREDSILIEDPFNCTN